jgi:hypothetical protein
LGKKLTAGPGCRREGERERVERAAGLRRAWPLGPQLEDLQSSLAFDDGGGRVPQIRVSLVRIWGARV